MNAQALRAVAAIVAPKSLAQIKATVAANLAERRPAFAGLTIAECSEHSRASMDDAFVAVEQDIG